MNKENYPNKISIIILTCCCLGLISCSNTTKTTPVNNSLNNHSNLIQYASKSPAARKVEKWNNQFGQGMVITTDHYQIYTTLTEPLMLSQIPAFIESAYKAYQKMLPEAIKSNTPMRVYLFADRDQWEKWTIDFAAPNQDIYLKIQRGAYYLNGDCVAYDIGRTRTFSVLAHEGWHQFNSRHFVYRLPSWLDEGIAMQFEAAKYKNGLFEFDTKQNLSRLGSLKYAMKSSNFIKPEQLIEQHPGMYLIHNDADSTIAFYAQSYALVRFLREDDYCKRLINFNNMIQGAVKGLWQIPYDVAKIAKNRNIPMNSQFNAYIADTTFKQYITEDFETLAADYIRFCNKITSNIVISN